MTVAARSQSKTNALLCGAFAVSAALSAVAAFHHEPWSDEADAWLIARDCSLSEIVYRAGIIGTPVLWHLTLLPLAKSGAPYLGMNIISLAAGLTSSALLVFRSRLAVPIKLLTPLSYLFIYEYSVLARSYSLSVAFIFTLAALHRQRFLKSWIFCLVLGLLANCNVHSLIISISIFAPYLFQSVWRREKLAPCLLFAVLAGLSIWQLIPPVHHHAIVTAVIPPTDSATQRLLGPVIALKQAYFPSFALLDHTIGSTHSGIIEKVLMSVASLTVLVSTILLIRRSKLAVWSMLSSFAGLSALFIVYLGGLRHWGFFMVMTIYSLWIACSEYGFLDTARNRAKRLILSLPLLMSLAYSAVFGVYACIEDIKRPFSGAPRAAAFIKSLPPGPVAVFDQYGSTALMPYLPDVRFYNTVSNGFGTFSRPEFFPLDHSTCATLDRLARVFPENAPLYVISTEPNDKPESYGYVLLYQSKDDPISQGESYYIFGRRNTNRGMGWQQNDR